MKVLSVTGNIIGYHEGDGGAAFSFATDDADLAALLPEAVMTAANYVLSIKDAEDCQSYHLEVDEYRTLAHYVKNGIVRADLDAAAENVLPIIDAIGQYSDEINAAIAELLAPASADTPAQ